MLGGNVLLAYVGVRRGGVMDLRGARGLIMGS